MANTVEKAKVAGFVDRGYNAQRRQKKMEEDEAEIKRLEAELRGETIDEEESQKEDEGNTEEQAAEEGAEATTKREPEADATEDESDSKSLTAEERSFKKRYGDLRRHLQQKEKAWEEEKKKLLDNPKSIVPPKSDEDIEAWINKYPDVAGIVQTIAKKQAEEMFNKADSRLQELDKLNREAEVAKAEAVIRKSHSDFDALRDSDDFHDWADMQPKWVQDALYENADDPKAVIRVIDLYKVDMGLTKEVKGKARKDAARDVPSRSKPNLDEDGSAEVISESQVARMSDKDFEANYEKIMQAQRSGKFKYDISGKAR